METEALIVRTWDDLVFRNRNRQYGAYLIRKAYSRRVMLGAGISIALLACFLIFSTMGHNVADIVMPPATDKGDKTLQPPPLFDRPQARPKPPTQTKSTSLDRTIRVVTELVEPITELQSDPVPTSETMDGATGGEGVVETGTIGSELPIVHEQTIHTYVQQMPVYEGGVDEMMKFIKKKIRYPDSPRRMGIEGTVFVSFVVNGDGSVSHVQVLRGFHPKCDEEALRVIGMLPGWIGGKQNGNPVSVRMVLPIKFALDINE
jgi:periplasmic protein TonB